MEENEQYAERNDEPNGKLIGPEKAGGHGAVIRKLVVQQLLVDEPSYKQTGEECAQGQHDLSGDEVEEVEQREAEQLKSGHGSHAERTADGQQRTDNGEDTGRLVTGQVQLFVAEDGAYLVHRDG
jgi:hypothetical protein